MPTTSTRRRRPATSDCSTTACWATRRSFSDRTWSKRVGRSSRQFKTCGGRSTRGSFPITRPAAGALMPQRSCSPKRGASGTPRLLIGSAPTRKPPRGRRTTRAFCRKTWSAGPGVPRTKLITDAVDAVKRSGLVTLGQRRVVEHGVDEVIDVAAEAQHGLADVYQLRRLGADDVDAEQPPVLAMKDQLQQARTVAENLAA